MLNRGLVDMCQPMCCISRWISRHEFIHTVVGPLYTQQQQNHHTSKVSKLASDLSMIAAPALTFQTAGPCRLLFKGSIRGGRTPYQASKMMVERSIVLTQLLLLLLMLLSAGPCCCPRSHSQRFVQGSDQQGSTAATRMGVPDASVTFRS